MTVEGAAQDTKMGPRPPLAPSGSFAVRTVPVAVTSPGNSASPAARLNRSEDSSQEGVQVRERARGDQRARLVLLYALHHAPAVVTRHSVRHRPSHEQVARAVAYLVEAGAVAVVSADAAPLRRSLAVATLTAIYTKPRRAARPGRLRPPPWRGVRRASFSARVRPEPASKPWQAPREAPFPLAHPLQQIWDLRDLGGEDRFEASERLMRRVVMGTV